MGTEKILDETVVDFMLDAGVSIEYIKSRQYREMKRIAIEKLQEIISIINDDDPSLINNHIANSPSGDGWGKDNHYIVFCGDVDMDIHDVMVYLEDRKKYHAAQISF